MNNVSDNPWIDTVIWKFDIMFKPFIYAYSAFLWISEWWLWIDNFSIDFDIACMFPIFCKCLLSDRLMFS